MVHAQAAHMVNIYEIGESDEEDDSTKNINSNKLDKTNGESYNNMNGSSCNGNENVSRFPSFLFHEFKLVFKSLILQLITHSQR